MKPEDLILDCQLLRINPITGWKIENAIMSGAEQKRLKAYKKAVNFKYNGEKEV